LARFGNGFLSKCNAALCQNNILQAITFIDTPGILSGEKQRLARGYDFEQVVKYLAEKVDCILLLFDAHKLDISDELKRTILVLAGQEEKIKVDRFMSDWLVAIKGLFTDHSQQSRRTGRSVVAESCGRPYVVAKQGIALCRSAPCVAGLVLGQTSSARRVQERVQRRYEAAL